MYKKILFKTSLFLVIPPIISYIVYSLWGFPILFVTAILYFLLFLLSIPAGEDVLSTISDYQTKRENHTFKTDNKISQKKVNIVKLIAFLVLSITYMIIYIEKIS